MVKWHHALHLVTGAMANRFNPTLTSSMLREWADELDQTADEMRQMAGRMDGPPAKKRKKS